jgi:general secretion pathway protein I
VRARGFTLVEVMVALAIVAIVLPTLLMSLYQQVDDTAYLRDKTIAQMVAVNKLSQIRLIVAATRTLAPGKDNGLATMADRDWYWWVETKTTEVEQFFRIDISVAAQEDDQSQPLYTLTAFLSGDLDVDLEGFEGSDENGGQNEGENGGGGGSNSNNSSPNLNTPNELPPGASINGA